MNRQDGFEIILKNIRTDSYKKLAFGIVFINLLIFVFFLLFPESRFTGISGIASVVLYFVYQKIRHSALSVFKLTGEYIFYILALVWLSNNYLLPVLLVFTGLVLKYALKPIRFIFTNEGIKKAFFPEREYNWDRFDSIILRAGILTMNFKNDNLIQSEVEIDTTFKESAFNDFARTLISDNRKPDEPEQNQ